MIPSLKTTPPADPVDLVALACASAPVDDEPTTREDEAAIAEADEAIVRGEVLSNDEARRLLGLAPRR
jgi:hypothetical protein